MISTGIGLWNTRRQWTPASVPGLLLRTTKNGPFYQDAGVTAAAIGDRVGRWNGSIGGNLNQTQVAAPDNRLVRTAWGVTQPAAPNKNECLTFGSVVLTGDFTIYQVWLQSAVNAQDKLRNPGTSARIVNFGNNSGIYVLDDAGGSSSSATAILNATQKWFRIRRQSGSVYVAGDGLAEIALSAGATGTMTFTNLGGNGATVTAGDGWGATLIYGNNLSVADRTLVEGYLAANEY